MSNTKGKVHNKQSPVRPSGGAGSRAMTALVLQKLEYAYSIGCTHEQAASHAGIGITTLNAYRRANPEMDELINSWRQKQFVKALATIDKSLDKTRDAQWWLERRASDMFGRKDKVQHNHLISLSDDELRQRLEQVNAQIIDADYQTIDQPKRLASGYKNNPDNDDKDQE